MKDLKWTLPDFQVDTYLKHALARYHAYVMIFLNREFLTEPRGEFSFLDLMATHPGTMLVPTLDIDLVWHTHQLTYANYQGDCVNYVGRFVDQ